MFDKSDLIKKLDQIYFEEANKFSNSVKKRCEKNNSKGFDQMIGRRYGLFWERIVKQVFYSTKEKTTEGLDVNVKELILEILRKRLHTEITKTDVTKLSVDLKNKVCKVMSDNNVSLCDVVINNGVKKAIELKWRIRWNDAKIVNELVLASSRLKQLDCEPVLLIRTKKSQNRPYNLRRFELSGWVVLTDSKANDFILDETGFDLFEWVLKKVDFWKEIQEYAESLKQLNHQKSDFIF